MRWLLAAGALPVVLGCPFYAQSLEQCSCRDLPASSGADSGECERSETEGGDCYLRWRDVEASGETAQAADERALADLARAAEAADYIHVFDPDSWIAKIPHAYLELADADDLERTPYRDALGYLAFTEPTDYEPTSLLQAVTLLLVPTVQRLAERGDAALPDFVSIIAEQRELIHAKMSSGGELVEFDTFLESSSEGCFELIFHRPEVNPLRPLTGLMLRTRHAEGPLC